jgi:formamidopyrimidine-DNA glycosylase
MPELPDITIYIESLESRIVGQPLERIRIASPFLLRSVDPPISEAESKKVLNLRRVGKQVVWELESELFLVFHLMIAGRFHWKKKGTVRSATRIRMRFCTVQSFLLSTSRRNSVQMRFLVFIQQPRKR